MKLTRSVHESDLGAEFEHKGYWVRIIRSEPGWSIEFDLKRSKRYEHCYSKSIIDAILDAKSLLDEWLKGQREELAIWQ